MIENASNFQALLLDRSLRHSLNYWPKLLVCVDKILSILDALIENEYVSYIRILYIFR